MSSPSIQSEYTPKQMCDRHPFSRVAGCEGPTAAETAFRCTFCARRTPRPRSRSPFLSLARPATPDPLTIFRICLPAETPSSEQPNHHRSYPLPLAMARSTSEGGTSRSGSSGTPRSGTLGTPRSLTPSHPFGLPRARSEGASLRERWGVSTCAKGNGTFGVGAAFASPTPTVFSCDERTELSAERHAAVYTGPQGASSTPFNSPCPPPAPALAPTNPLPTRAVPALPARPVRPAAPALSSLPYDAPRSLPILIGRQHQSLTSAALALVPELEEGWAGTFGTGVPAARHGWKHSDPMWACDARRKFGQVAVA